MIRLKHILPLIGFVALIAAYGLLLLAMDYWITISGGTWLP